MWIYVAFVIQIENIIEDKRQNGVDNCICSLHKLETRLWKESCSEPDLKIQLRVAIEQIFML